MSHLDVSQKEGDKVADSIIDRCRVVCVFVRVWVCCSVIRKQEYYNELIW